MIIAIVIILLIASSAIGAYFYMKNKSQQQPEPFQQVFSFNQQNGPDKGKITYLMLGGLSDDKKKVNFLVIGDSALPNVKAEVNVCEVLESTDTLLKMKSITDVRPPPVKFMKTATGAWEYTLDMPSGPPPIALTKYTGTFPLTFQTGPLAVGSRRTITIDKDVSPNTFKITVGTDAAVSI